VSELHLNSAMFRLKASAEPTLCEHFLRDKIYTMHYITDPPAEQGWFCLGEDNSEWWLSPWDGRNHNILMHERYIMDNFQIVDVKTSQQVPIFTADIIKYRSTL
jgi:hypothetical protein